jgi:alkanesulfonate monooxygenase SsuD/methylene tetrahydromethanopterin reductase-like flavin-dependent oxidoreductase (luciferase family)
LQICLQMWGEDESAFDGRHYRLERTLNSPAPLSRPHPFVLIGGGGERKTLRLVAQYANACNIFGGGDVARHKLDVLRSHCETVGRDYVFARNPEPLSAIELLAAVAGEVSGW